MSSDLPNECCPFLPGTNRQSRLQQLIDWCGGEQFNGCLIFDECHKAKHFVPVSDLLMFSVAVKHLRYVILINFLLHISVVELSYIPIWINQGTNVVTVD